MVMAAVNANSEKVVTEKSRTLLVQKDDSGYGLTLSGDRPTRVQTVKTGGASHRAGVREGDVIIKVNGKPVTESLHSEVVKLIQTGKYVALTVVHSSRLPPASSGSTLSLQVGSGDPPTGPGPGNVSRSESVKSASITNPQPVGEDGQKKLVTDKVYTIQLMVEQETRYCEELRAQLARSNSTKTKKELEKTMKNLSRLTEQLKEEETRLPSPEARPAAPPRRDSLCQAPPPLPARNPKPGPRSSTPTHDAAPPPPPRSISSSALPPPPPKLAKLNKRHGSHENVSAARGSSRRSSQLMSSPVKTSPDSSQPIPVSHTRTRSSPCSLEQTLEVAKSWSPSDNNDRSPLCDGRAGSPRYETPPGTPPPPYNQDDSVTGDNNNSLSAHSSIPIGRYSPAPHLVTWDGLINNNSNIDKDIMTMESDSDDQEEELGGVVQTTEGDHGPFNNHQELLLHLAHLAVFLNYVISNADPSCLLFYLITDAYKEGTIKEMRKWAYEIHSCFLVPNAPLELPRLDHQVVANVDSFLAEENSERDSSLLKLFWKSRSRAREEIKLQLDAFRTTREAGLGAIFGPPDHELKLCDENLNKRMQVVDELLVPVLETMAEDLENATDRSATLASSLATVLAKTFSTKSPVANAIIEKCPTFVSKEKRKEKFFGRNRKNLTVQGHHFVLKQYDQVTYCNHSQGIIWGIGYQGYQCTNCSFDVHKKFVNKVEETCVGPKRKHPKRSSMGMFHNISRLGDVGRIMSNPALLEPNRKPSGAPGSSSVSPSPSMRLPGDNNSILNSTTISSVSTDNPDSVDTTKVLPSSSSLDSVDHSVTSPSAHDQVLLFGAGGGGSGKSPSILDQLISSSQHSRELNNKGPSVRRTESAKDGAKRKEPRQYTRKHSDPNLGPRASIDIVEVGPCFNSGSSSASSIPGAVDLRAWESPHHMLTAVETVTDVHIAPVDSDFETEVDPPDWRLSISIEQLQKLKPKQRKRQDVINELFHTERSHVRNLKVLAYIFRRPLLESGVMPVEVVDRLFPNIDEVLSVHNRYNTAMKKRMKQGFPIGHIGDILTDMFGGVAGDRLIEVGAEFTKNQKFTIEELKRLRGRDTKLEQFLESIEKRPECRKLQLQALLAVEHQRLVKYPLLLEQIARVSEDTVDREELEVVKLSVIRSKEILEVMDKQVAEAQNRQELVEIQRCLDTSPLDKHVGPDHPICQEYKNIDLTKHRLIHEGSLKMKLGDTRRVKNIDLTVLLLEDCIMLLEKSGDKFLLKFHMSEAGNVQGRQDSRKLFHSPIIKFSTMLVRPVATDKCAFYLLNTTQVGPQIYELVAGTPSDRKTWFHHITEASAAFKQREQHLRGLGEINELKRDAGRLSVPEDLNLKVPSPGSAAERSQSFHEQSRPAAAASPTSPPVLAPRVLDEAEEVRRKIEALWRKDEEVSRALEEKQRLVADILKIPRDDVREVSENSEDSVNKEKNAKEVLLEVLKQADNLTSLVNSSLKVTEEDGSKDVGRRAAEDGRRPGEEGKRPEGPPGEKLIQITTAMNQHLTSLLTIIQEREEERESWRRELDRSQEQVRSYVMNSVTSPPTSSSRPNSFISLESGEENINITESGEDSSNINETSDTVNIAMETVLDNVVREVTPTNEEEQQPNNNDEDGEHEAADDDNVNNNSNEVIDTPSLTLLDATTEETCDSSC